MGTKLLSTVAVATIVLVAADIVWSRLFWHRELRMTRQEVKDELKQIDGDPIVKARLRSLARDRLRKRMMAAVPQGHARDRQPDALRGRACAMCARRAARHW